jgi:BirA family transcriptional regulator, biotin operon repressor / biotin---[acetyl-CoA-carboxylase] ligase
MPFIELQTVDSTNNYAFSQIHAGLAQHGMTVFAHEQTAGKGQRGKKWLSARGSNIAMSILLNPAPLAVTEQFRLSACVALAVFELFRRHAGKNVAIKWPNDLYWKDRKAGGILIESIVRSREAGVRSTEYRNITQGNGSWEWAVVGVGININQDSFPPGLPNPVSLREITGKNSDPVELAKELCQLLNALFDELIRGGFENIYQQYIAGLYKLDQTVRLKKDNRAFEATIKGVSKTGRLIVQHGIEEEFDFGTIEWVI